MNRISSQQRKLVYLIIIVLLLAPIVYFGAPGNGKDENSGGKLAQLRSKYDLGETSLGNVDPASATMNLVLLGLRGIASNMLWSQAVEQKSQKDWAGLRATVDSIVLLQPHFKQVWEFQGWNLAYNVSAEWDGVADRYEWVKEGAKFMMRGSDRNYKYPELYWESGRILGQKIGRADEKLFFRRYFLDDPNREGGGPDPEVNPDGKDNYLAAKDWFEKANEVELQPGVSQSRLARV
ncbi:MAG TPA: IRE (iron responsive element), partial [Planctomycetaceae bacterium]|nr:IRE (iron responsive element) [Planctomycetaceae bacterium]